MPIDTGTGTGAASLNPLNEITSIWDGLNPHLVASIFEVDHTCKRIGDVVVKAALADETTLDFVFNWQSPFEQSGPDSKAPALMAMLQSGALQPLAERAGESVNKALGGGIEAARGRAGITKLNSTQVFSGMPPVKFTATLLLRAWRDPDAEVERPLDQLMQWGLPQKLAPEGTMVTAAIDFVSGSKNLIDAALPSIAPTLVAITYKRRTYGPMVLESIGVPLSSPIDALGRFVQLSLPVAFSTLTAMDRFDWMALMNRGTSA